MSKKTRSGSGRAALPPSLPDWACGLILFLLVLAIYQPLWYAGFIWDDDLYVTENPAVIGPFGLKEIWTTTAADICPLTITTFWLEHKLWGLDPLGYHLVNVLMHGGSAIVLWRLLRRLEMDGAWFGAALWAVHPVLVESVAWVSELKNTQSTLFYLLSLLFFARWLKSGAAKFRDWNYVLTLLFAALAMASKSSTMILPLVLALCVWWMERRWRWMRLAAIAPTVLLAIPAGLLSVRTQGMHHVEWAQRGIAERLITAGDAIWFYLGKLVVPYPLMATYPRWQIDTSNALSYVPLLGVLVLFAALWFNRKTWGRPWFFALTYFAIVLLPVLGLVEHGFMRYSFVADHFQNLACMAPLALLGAGLARIGNLSNVRIEAVLATIIIFILGSLSWQKAWAYRSQETLWNDTLRWNPDSAAAYGNLGGVYFHRGQVDPAIEEFREALVINPNYGDAHYDLGMALAQKGQLDEAIAEFHHALDINPDDESTHFNLGLALEKKGSIDDAVAEYQKTLELQPADASAEGRLGIIFAQRGQYEDAIPHFQNAARLDPTHAQAQYNLGLALYSAGRIDESIAAYTAGVELDPKNANIRFHLAMTLARAHRLEEAIVQFREIVKAMPDDPDAHNNLGAALLQAGQVQESILEFQQALRLQPGHPDAQNNLAKAQAIAGKPSAK